MEIELNISAGGYVSGTIDGFRYFGQRTGKGQGTVLYVKESRSSWSDAVKVTPSGILRTPSFSFQPWKWVEWDETGVIGEV